MNTLLRRTGVVLLGLLTLVVLLLGTIILLSGVSAYLEGTFSDGTPFGTTLLGTGFMSLGMAVIFGHRARASYIEQRSKYGMPDSPVRFFMLLSVTGLFGLFTLLSFSLYSIFLMQ